MIENTDGKIKQLNLDNKVLEDKKLKKCTKCKNVYPATPKYFHRRKEGKYGLDSWCKKCHKISHKKIHIRKTYGITFDQLQEMLIKQNNRCAICGIPFKEDHKLYYKFIPKIDHDHKTGEIRELLCNSCNRLLGFAVENPLILINTIKYLKIHKEKGA